MVERRNRYDRGLIDEMNFLIGTEKRKEGRGGVQQVLDSDTGFDKDVAFQLSAIGQNDFGMGFDFWDIAR
jgi:hypothetical protein